MEIVVNNMKNFWKGKKVFITGHTGFKGSWLLIWLLKKEAQICGYSLKENKNSLFEELIKTNPKLKNKFHSNYGDINDFANLKQKISEFKPDIIFLGRSTWPGSPVMMNLASGPILVRNIFI